MPIVRCSSERCKLAKKIRIFIQQLFYCGSIMLLTGTLICLPFSDKIFISSLANTVLIFFWCVMFFSCGFLMCAPSWFWRGELSDHRSTVSDVSIIYRISEEGPPQGVVVESPPSYDSVAAASLSSTRTAPTPPPKYEDAMNAHPSCYGELPPYRDSTGVCPVHIPPDKATSDSVRLPRSAQQWRYLQWPEPRVWHPREPQKADISYLQFV